MGIAWELIHTKSLRFLNSPSLVGMGLVMEYANVRGELFGNLGQKEEVKKNKEQFNILLFWFYISVMYYKLKH